MHSIVCSSAEEAHMYATELGWRFVTKWEFIGSGRVKIWFKEEALKNQELPEAKGGCIDSVNQTGAGEEIK